MLASISSLIVLFVLMNKRTEYPTNYYLLGVFTLLQALTIGSVASFFDKWIVIEAFLITTTLVACLTAYTFQSKRDFSAWGASLFTFLWVLIFAGFFQIFFQHTMFDFMVSVAGALLFSLFIIFDTHMIMKKLNPEEYIVGVINLYLDIINLFLEILKILDSLKRN
jgi:FtsH-binding integral membrane protein